MSTNSQAKPIIIWTNAKQSQKSTSEPVFWTSSLSKPFWRLLIRNKESSRRQVEEMVTPCGKLRQEVRTMRSRSKQLKKTCCCPKKSRASKYRVSIKTIKNRLFLLLSSLPASFSSAFSLPPSTFSSKPTRSYISNLICSKMWVWWGRPWPTSTFLPSTSPRRTMTPAIFPWWPQLQPSSTKSPPWPTPSSGTPSSRPFTDRLKPWSTTSAESRIWIRLFAWTSTRRYLPR